MKNISHPYRNHSKNQWLRGNLHAHTVKSDGSRLPQDVIDDYAQRGYDFLMISDHDTLMSETDLSHFEARGMILIPGNEISRGASHLLHVNAGTHVQPNSQRQIVLNEITRDAESFSIVCHPNWQDQFDHTSMSKLQEWVGYVGIEIYNGVIGRLDGSPYATNKWDMLLSQGRQCWGYANDDSHRGELDVGLGWNMVNVKEKSCEAIVAALREGNFYASNGVFIKSIVVDGVTIRVETENAERVVALRDVGKRIASHDGNSLEIEMPEDAKYVRFECYGRGEKMAWTQPFFPPTHS